MPYDHGITITERATSVQVPITGTAGLQVIFGTAPIHMAANPTAVVNKPILANSYAEAVAAVGYSDEWDKFTLCQSIDACFRVFNIAPIVLINVLDPANTAHVQDNAEASKTPVDSIVTLAEDYILPSSLVVKDAAGTKTFVAGTDYSTAFDDNGKLVITLISAAIKLEASLKVTSKSLKPGGVVAADIVGGIDESGKETGLELVRHIYPLFGYTPGLLLAPGWSHDATVAVAMQAKCTGINGDFGCECLIDIDSTTDGATVYTDINNAKELAGIVSPHAAALWPKVAVGTKQYWYSAVFGALTAYTDARNDDIPYISPSNKRMPITGLVLDDGTPVIMDKQQGNVLNGQGVITAINLRGFRSWGNNTAAYPDSADPKDRWFCVRRYITWDANTFILTFFDRVDDPANKRLVESVVDSWNIRNNSLAARGYIAGAKIVYLEDENPVTDIIDGKITFHSYIAPWPPAENIHVILEFDPTMIETALGGENE